MRMGRCSAIFALYWTTLVVIASHCLVTRAENGARELNGDNLREVLEDFLSLLIDEDAKMGGDDGSVGRQGGRRLQQFFGDLDADEIFDDFLEDFELAASLSDFVDGLLTNPVADFAAKLPQSQEEAEAMIRAQYNEYCSDVQKSGGGKVGDSCQSWVAKLELTPGKCDVVNRVNQQFACEPPMLVYTRTPPTCISRHTEPAEFISKECKVAKAKGVGKDLVLGGGKFDVRLKLGLQDVDILSTLDLSDIADILDIGSLF